LNSNPINFQDFPLRNLPLWWCWRKLQPQCQLDGAGFDYGGGGYDGGS